MQSRSIRMPRRRLQKRLDPSWDLRFRLITITMRFPYRQLRNIRKLRIPRPKEFTGPSKRTKGNGDKRAQHRCCKGWIWRPRLARFSYARTHDGWMWELLQARSAGLR